LATLAAHTSGTCWHTRLPRRRIQLYRRGRHSVLHQIWRGNEPRGRQLWQAPPTLPTNGRGTRASSLPCSRSVAAYGRHSMRHVGRGTGHRHTRGGPLYLLVTAEKVEGETWRTARRQAEHRVRRAGRRRDAGAAWFISLLPLLPSETSLACLRATARIQRSLSAEGGARHATCGLAIAANSRCARHTGPLVLHWPFSAACVLRMNSTCPFRWWAPCAAPAGSTLLPFKRPVPHACEE